MSLAAIIADVEAKLASKYPTLTSLIGLERLKEHNAPPRLVWMPIDDQFSGVKMWNCEPKPIYTVERGCAVHLWAHDADADPSENGYGPSQIAKLEALVNDVVAALFLSVHGPQLALRGGQWEPATRDAFGRGYILTFAIRIPITLAPVTEVTLVPSAPQQNQAVPKPSSGMEFPPDASLRLPLGGTTVGGDP